jgi:hypothetical protein
LAEYSYRLVPVDHDPFVAPDESDLQASGRTADILANQRRTAEGVGHVVAPNLTDYLTGAPYQPPPLPPTNYVGKTPSQNDVDPRLIGAAADAAGLALLPFGGAEIRGAAAARDAVMGAAHAPSAMPPLSAMPVDTPGGIAALREAMQARLAPEDLQRLDRLYADPRYEPDMDRLQNQASVPIDRPILVHRGAKTGEDLFDNTRHLSTSDREYPARTFARNLSGDKQGVRAEIHVQPGVNAFVPDSGINHEVVLGPGTQYEIMGRRLDPDTGQEVLTVIARKMGQ